MITAEVIAELLAKMPPISLEEMDGISLMNRIDTKFVASLDMVPLILSRALGNYHVQRPAQKTGLAEYDTLYYDTPGHAMYLMHHNRRACRQKIRTRQYLDTNDCFAEVKNKNNHGRTKKKRIPVPTAAFENVLQDARAFEFLSQKSLFPTSGLSPALETSFRRITLVNNARTERVTIDLGLAFSNRRTAVTASLPELVILELKRDGRAHSDMLDILSELRIHPRKISKYCIGIALTDKNMKQNNLKLKKRMISKLSAIAYAQAENGQQ